MLHRLRVNNFRLLNHFELKRDSDDPLVLVGPNASGKSTVLGVLDFTQRCATDGLAAAVEAHGGMASLRSAGSRDPVEIETDWKFFTKNRQEYQLRWRLTFQELPNGEARVVHESLVNDATPGTPIVSTENGLRQAFPEDGGAPSQIKSRTQISFEAVADEDRHRTLWLFRALLRTSSVLGTLPTSPRWARDDTGAPSPRDTMTIGTQKRLSRQGMGLAVVLYNLHTDHEPEWKLLESSFKAEFPFVKRIIFPPDAGGSRISFAFEDVRYPGRKLYASEMSDGMVAYLCLLAAVLDPNQRGVLALDEPDTHMHPSALRRFMALAHRKHDGRVLIIATHSNALLDELKNPAKSIRIIEATPQGTALRKLDPEALDTWRKEYSLSEMRRTGLLDRANSDYGSDA